MALIICPACAFLNNPPLWEINETNNHQMNLLRRNNLSRIANVNSCSVVVLEAARHSIL